MISITAALLVAGGCSSAGGRFRPADAWTLVWSDEFNDRDGSAPSPQKWGYDIGGSGWGNHELESYTSRSPENVAIRKGALSITARRERYTGPDGVARDFTSARLVTRDRFVALRGRVEARIRIPAGQGVWPAFWMLGDDVKTAGWPACGEIDIMENIGREPSTVHGTVHGPGYSGGKAIGAPYSLPGNRRFADDFHVFAVEWEQAAIRFYVDDVLYETTTPANLPAGARWVFDHPFYVILNLAVGGDWPGNPDASTRFPQTMRIDYVRVYRRASR
jgi:beta-glucanase (GH16 family)